MDRDRQAQWHSKGQHLRMQGQSQGQSAGKCKIAEYSSNGIEKMMVIHLTGGGNIICITCNAFTLPLTSLKINYKNSLHYLDNFSSDSRVCHIVFSLSCWAYCPFVFFYVKFFCDNIWLPYTLQIIALPLSFSGVARVFQIPVTHLPLTICYYHLNEKSLVERWLSGYSPAQGCKFIIPLSPPILSNSDKHPAESLSWYESVHFYYFSGVTLVYTAFSLKACTIRLI